MRRFVSLPSIEQHKSRAIDQGLCNGLVQARLDDADLKLRREKLCRVEARQVEHVLPRRNAARNTGLMCFTGASDVPLLMCFTGRARNAAHQKGQSEGGCRC